MTRIQKVKQHLKDNQTVYYVGAACLLVGAAGATIATGRVDGPLLAKQINILTHKPTQTIEVFVEALGDPGNIIQDLTTGTIYASQGEAARALGVHASTVSRHLHGEFPSVKGHTLKNLGKAMIAE